MSMSNNKVYLWHFLLKMLVGFNIFMPLTGRVCNVSNAIISGEFNSYGIGQIINETNLFLKSEFQTKCTTADKRSHCITVYFEMSCGKLTVRGIGSVFEKSLRK